MHQPFYKDLVSGEYRLPWVRLHALKDYYGMVKLLEEFPQVHQNFNIVPSLVAQIEDYNSGVFKDPFWDIAAKPAAELSLDERHFALTYFFQAHGERMIGRYPRYRQLWEQVRAAGTDPAHAAITFTERDYRDLQVLSQIAWFDEYYLNDPAVQALIEKGQGYSEEDQRFVMSKQHEILKGVLPAYREAAARGSVELSPSPYYHPILPLICDTNAGRESVPGLPLPSERFRHPDDAEEQIRRALDAHERTFGVRPVGMWPSEGSVSDEAVGIAAQLGVQWLATDEGVLGRSIGHEMSRDGDGYPRPEQRRKALQHLPMGSRRPNDEYGLPRSQDQRPAGLCLFRDGSIRGCGASAEQHQTGRRTGSGIGARCCAVDYSGRRKRVGELRTQRARLPAALLR